MAPGTDIRTLSRQYANLCFVYASYWAKSTQFIERVAHDHGADVANIVMNEGNAIAKDMLTVCRPCRPFADNEREVTPTSIDINTDKL